jgi:hypothetical protein
VSRRSIREPIFEGGYDVPQYYADERFSPRVLNAHALLVARESFGVGILVLERRPVIQHYRWTSRPEFELLNSIDDLVRWSIAHIWLHPKVRGQGIADEMVRVAAQGVCETPDTIGWLSPITRRAFHLMARVTVDGFHRAVQDLPPSETVTRPFVQNPSRAR